jgi:hypothetical protein
MDWADIPKEAYGLAGVALGGGITLLTTLLYQRRQRKLEREKLRDERRDALSRELGTHFQAVAVDFSSLAHSMCRLTWQAGQGNMSQAMIDDYNAEIHAALPKVVGGKIMVGTLEPELGYQLDLFVDLAREVDEKIALACLAYAKDNAAGLDQLKALNLAARDLDDIICKKLGELGSGKRSLGKWMLRKWTASRARKQVNLDERAG